MSNTVVGLTIDSDKIRAVEVRHWRGRRPQCVRVGYINLEPGAFEQGTIVDAGVIAAAIVDLWHDTGFTTKRVVVSVDGRQSIVRRTDLPAASKEQIRRSAGFDIEELLSYPLEEAIFDLAEISTEQRGDTTWVSMLVVSIHESTRDSLLELVRAAGLKPVSLHLSAEALARSVRVHDVPDAPDPGGEGSITAIVNVEDSESDIVIRDGDGTLFSRTLAAGVGESVFSVADELESNLQGLAGYRSRDESDADRRASATNAGVLTVVEGVRRTLDYYRTDLDNRKLSHVVLSGSRAGSGQLRDHMAEVLGTIVELGDPPQRWDETLGDWQGYETAIGTVLCESRSGKERRSFSLKPWHLQKRRSARLRVGAGVGMAVVVAFGLIQLTMSHRLIVAERDEAASAAESQLRSLEGEVANFDESVAMRTQLKAETNRVEDVMAQEIAFSVVMQDLATVMPANSQLTSIQMRRAGTHEEVVGYVATTPIGVVTLNALVKNMAAVGSFVDQISAASFIDGIWLHQSTFGQIGASEDIGALFSVEAVITEAAQPRSEFFDGELDE